MEQIIKALLIEKANEWIGQPLDSKQIQFQPTRKDVEGDVTLLIFPIAKILKTNPVEAGERIGALLQNELDEISHFQVISGFLNLTLKNEYWLEKLKNFENSQNLLKPTPDSKGTMMVEYASPNTNKPLHLGHLRNIFLGYSVSNILKANGYKVVKTQVINDRGIHICKSMLAWERFSPLNERGERETPSNTGLKGDKLVGKYYVAFDQHLQVETKEIVAQWKSGEWEGFSEDVTNTVQKLLKAQSEKEGDAAEAIEGKIKELAKNQTPIMRDAKEMLVKWEARDPQTYLLWSTMNGWVYEGFDRTYETMGVDFDKLYYESDTYLLGKDQVMEGIAKGVFYQKEDGSVWIDLSDEGLDEKLVLRSDGTAVYMTQDIGTAIDRFKDYPDLEGIIYTVGNEQDYHFKVLFLILKKLGYSWAENCFHLSYGMVDLPTGKMKSREGTVVDADDLMEEVILSAGEMTAERGHLEGMNEEERQNLYRQIGLAGLKYYLLKVDPKKRMLFNPAESIDLNGNTGPFIQYTYARICSLLAKAGSNGSIQLSIQLTEEEKTVLKNLTQFPEVLAEASANYSPAVIANYVYELVKSYNHFYQQCKIVTETNEEIKSNRLGLSYQVSRVVKECLILLGIESPQRM